MSDLVGGNAPSGAVSAGRSQNGGSRPAVTAGSAAAPGQIRFRTPRDVMAERRKREARRAEEQEAQRRMQEEEIRRQPTENVVGVGDDRRQTGGRAPLAEIQPGATPGSTGVTTSRRRTENIPTTNGGIPRPVAATNPTQPRPVSAQQQAGIDPASAGQINRNRTEALEKLSMQATAGNKPQTQPSQQQQQQPPSSQQQPQQPQQQQQQQTQPPPTGYPRPTPSAQPTGRAGFPHAFERWETLSSHWEGLTSYWIHRLEANTEELNGKPIDQQMARQITDLSAAGANLFHAVVELQRLRASSERKFQRWFFETRNEQEQAQERIADLERQLRHEREHGGTNTAAVEAVKAEKNKAEELVREMKRELQISKEEARRAWEELGRREQEEREHTTALRDGQPTQIGGVQVVPMAGMSSRYLSTSSRPQTRGGPIPGGPGPTQLSGQQQPGAREGFSRSQTTLESPEQEQAQFTYQPGQTSPTETDPFTETSYANEPQPLLRHEPDTQFYPATTRSQAQSSGAPSAARAAVSPTRGQTQSTSPSRFYQGAGTSAAPYQPLTSAASAQRPGTSGSDNRSYIPSTASGNGSEEEYHINPDGSYLRDAHGRKIPSNQPILGTSIEEEEEQMGEDDDEDYTAEVERERLYAQQYQQRQAAVPQVPRVPGTALPSTLPTSQQGAAAPTTQSQTSPTSRSYSSTISASSQPVSRPVPSLAPSYEGSGYGVAAVHADDEIPSNLVTAWEGMQVTPRHHHPSRLSAIIEERSSRTSPSRTSYASEGNPVRQRDGGGNTTHNNGNGNVPH